MRIRLFLAFSLVTVISIALLGYLIQTNTQTTITTFAQSGGFVGADRLVNNLSSYYQTNGSWDGVETYIVSLVEPGGGEHTTTGSQSTTGQSSSGQGGGQGSGQGSGQGGGNRYGGSMGSTNAGGGMMGATENFSLLDASGNLVYSQTGDVIVDVPSEVLDNAITITVDQQTVGYLIPESSLIDLTDIISQNLTEALSKSFFTTIMVSSAVALLLAFFFAYVLMQPIRQLTTAAQKLGQGDLTQRVEVGGSNEVRQMANTFNQMAESLQKATQTRKSMTADIAHELRNPLSVQRANLEALQDGVYPLTIENLEPVVRQNKMLTQLVEDLRTLALVDAESLTLDCQPVELTGFLEQIVENFTPQFAQHDIQLDFVPDPTGQHHLLEIDPQRITQIISNLLQNARRHTPQGGLVTVAVRSDAAFVSVSVQDNGEGIPPDALPQLFERFYRADQSRARDKGGTGLGLTIARRLAEAHRGTLTAANAPEGGAVFTLTLPKTN